MGTPRGVPAGRRPRPGYLRLAIPVVAVLTSLGALTLAGRPAGAAPAVARGPLPSAVLVTSTSSTVAASLTLTQWKQRYEAVIGVVADDALVLVTDGKKAAKHPTRANGKQTLKDCRTWLGDARRAGGKAPPIPSAAAEANWKALLASSKAASSACITSLTKGSKKAAKQFRKQLAAVNNDEAKLTAEFTG
jgi:hypothetical protein